MVLVRPFAICSTIKTGMETFADVLQTEAAKNKSLKIDHAALQRVMNHDGSLKQIDGERGVTAREFDIRFWFPRVPPSAFREVPLFPRFLPLPLASPSLPSFLPVCIFCPPYCVHVHRSFCKSVHFGWHISKYLEL